jgi:hypothetical protein
VYQLSDKALDLTTKLLDFNPMNRLGANKNVLDILNHEFFDEDIL